MGAEDVGRRLAPARWQWTSRRVMVNTNLVSEVRVRTIQSSDFVGDLTHDPILEPTRTLLGTVAAR